MGIAVTLVGRGPNGETIVAENETALDLYLFKHNLPAYERPTPKAGQGRRLPRQQVRHPRLRRRQLEENKDDATGIKSADSGDGRRREAHLLHLHPAVRQGVVGQSSSPTSATRAPSATTSS